MVRETALVALRWDGAQTLKAARAAMTGGCQVDIELPLEVHYAIFRHLNADAQGRRAPQKIDATGGADMLAHIATVAGLEPLARLVAAVKRARYSVRVTSPEPVLSLIPPAAKR
jgi:hypothetical protein